MTTSKIKKTIEVETVGTVFILIMTAIGIMWTVYHLIGFGLSLYEMGQSVHRQEGTNHAIIEAVRNLQDDVRVLDSKKIDKYSMPSVIIR